MTATAGIAGVRFNGLMRRFRVAVGKWRCNVLDVNDVDVGERLWEMVTGLPLLFSAVGAPTSFSRYE